MKVCHIITGLNTGGAEMMLYKLLSASDRGSFEHVVVSLMGRGTMGGRIKDLGVPVYTMNISIKLMAPLALLRLIPLIYRLKPDIIQGWMYHGSLAASLVKCFYLRHVPLLWNIRCSYMDMRYYSKLSSLVIVMLSKLSRHPDAVIVNASSGRQAHVELNFRPKRWMIIPNGFNLKEFKPNHNPQQRSTIKNLLNVPVNVFLIGVVARYDPMKDHSNFLKAAQHLLKKNINVHFVLVGHKMTCENSDLFGLIKELKIEREVHLLGERNDISKIMPLFDILVSASFPGEGFPNVIGEAMACGVPCVVTDVGGSAYIVGETGVAVPPRNYVAIADACASVLDMPDSEREALGFSARQRIANLFSLEKISRQYEGFYYEIVSKRKT